MKTTRTFRTLSVCLLLAAPACNDDLASIGDDGGAGHGGMSLGAGGSSVEGTPTSGGANACQSGKVISIPVCSNSNAVLQYDSAGCPLAYACPGEPNSCVCYGTRPLVANNSCTDGSMGGPLCVTQADGSCSWIVRSCPDSGGVYCNYNNVDYAAGTSFNSSDGCNTCSCGADGQIACTTMYCAPRGSGGSSGVIGVGGGTPVEWGGASAVGGAGGCATHSWPMIQCSNGTPEMQYDSAGCPAGYACPGQSVEGCTCAGPVPTNFNQICADGTRVGAVCQNLPDGSSCAWGGRNCPAPVGSGGTSGVAYCIDGNVVYAPGATYGSSDGCNTCTCYSNGQIGCTANYCGRLGSGGSPALGSGGSPPVGSGGQTGTVTCPSINLYVTCPNYQPVNDPATACTTGFVCPRTSTATCPSLVTTVPVCATGPAALTYDAAGCATGYVCSTTG
jgi:hypothetical protein